MHPSGCLYLFAGEILGLLEVLEGIFKPIMYLIVLYTLFKMIQYIEISPRSPRKSRMLSIISNLRDFKSPRKVLGPRTFN